MKRMMSTAITCILMVVTLTYAFACGSLPDMNKLATIDIGSGSTQDEGSKPMVGTLSRQGYYRASVSSNGEQGNGNCNSPSISADGRHIAFKSAASNMVTPTSGEDIVVHDRISKRTTLVSVPVWGSMHSGFGSYPSISADGRYIAFHSKSDYLVNGDSSFGRTEVFVRDTKNNTCTLASVSSSGLKAPYDAEYPRISADGRYVVFRSGGDYLGSDKTLGSLGYGVGGNYASTYANIFIRDRQNNSTHTVNIANGQKIANGQSFEHDVSADGRYVAFQSQATNMVSGDENKDSPDVFVGDLQGYFLSGTKLAGIAPNGKQFSGGSRNPGISGNGRYVAFSGYNIGENSRIYVRDLQNSTTMLVTPNLPKERALTFSKLYGNAKYIYPDISRDGRWVVFMVFDPVVDSNVHGNFAIVLHDMTTNLSTLIVSQKKIDNLPMLNYAPQISDDGNCVAFASDNSDIVGGDTNNCCDVFIYYHGISTQPPADSQRQEIKKPLFENFLPQK